MAPLLPQTQVLSSSLIALPLPHAHLEGTLLPRGFFLGLGLIYLAALAVDRLAAAWRLPGAAAVLLLGLLIPTEWLTQAQPLGPLQVETLHRVSLALLIFYAGLKTDLRRIRGMTAYVVDTGQLAVFVAGVLLSNGRYRIGRFEQQALGRVMHPLNTAAEITVLLLLSLLVKPAALLTVLPLGLALAIVLPLARLLAVWAVMPAPTFPWRDRLVVAGCGLRAAVPLALAVSMTEELPHLRGVAPALAEPLGSQLLALLFVAVLADLLLQPLLMRLLLRFSPEASPP